MHRLVPVSRGRSSQESTASKQLRRVAGTPLPAVTGRPGGPSSFPSRRLGLAAMRIVVASARRSVSREPHLARTRAPGESVHSRQGRLYTGLSTRPVGKKGTPTPGEDKRKFMVPNCH